MKGCDQAHYQMDPILWTQIYFGLHLAGLLFSASLEIISVTYESGMQKWLSQDEDIERISYYRRICDSAHARWASYNRSTRGLITAVGTILVFLLIVGGNWLLAMGSLVFTVPLKQNALTDLVSSLFTAEASFFGIAFIVFVLLIERLAGNDYLDRPTFRRFMRKSWTAPLLAASVTLLVLTGFVLYWISSGSKVSTVDYGFLLGVCIPLVFLAGWVVKVAFTGIDFATPGQIFIELKRELQGISNREMRREERARKANGKLNQVILSYEGDPAPTSPLLFRGRDTPAYFLEGEEEITIRRDSHDKVVYDANLQKLETVMRELIGDDEYPPIRAELALKVGDIISGSQEHEEVTVAYIDEAVSEHVISALEDLFVFLPIPPLRIGDTLGSIENMAIQAIDDNLHQKLVASLDQVSDLQSEVLQFRAENLGDFLRSASDASQNSRLNVKFKGVLNETAKAAIEQGNKRSISAIFRTWEDIVKDAIEKKDNEVLSIYTHVLDIWVTKADEQPHERQERFGEELEERWKNSSGKALSVLQNGLRELQENLYREESESIHSLNKSALHFEYSLAQEWYLIRESVDEQNIDRVQNVWEYGRTNLAGKTTLSIPSMKRELEKVHIALSSEPENEEQKQAKENLEGVLERLTNIHSLQHSLRLATLAYGLRRLQNGRIDASDFLELLKSLRVYIDHHYNFADELRSIIKDTDREGAVSEAFSRSGLRIREEMVDGYFLCALYSIEPNGPAPTGERNLNAVQKLQEKAGKPSGGRPLIPLPPREKCYNLIRKLSAAQAPEVIPDQVEQRVDILSELYRQSFS